MTAAKKQSLFAREILLRSCLESVKKLEPRYLMKNPVIFVTEVGALITTVELVLTFRTEPWGFNLQISL